VTINFVRDTVTLTPRQSSRQASGRPAFRSQYEPRIPEARPVSLTLLLRQPLCGCGHDGAVMRSEGLTPTLHPCAPLGVNSVFSSLRNRSYPSPPHPPTPFTCPIQKSLEILAPSVKAKCERWCQDFRRLLNPASMIPGTSTNRRFREWRRGLAVSGALG